MRVTEFIAEDSQRYVLYLNGQPVSYYSTEDEAEYQGRLIAQRVPDTYVEVKKETCKLTPVELNENLRKWFKEKWVRFNPQGKIMGPCARGSDKEGKPKCLPQAKAHALGKKGRASAAAKKRREDPNPERRGRAKNVATKVREEQQIEFVDVDAIHAFALREHLLSNPALFENREDFQQMQTFLNTHATSSPKINKSYVYASVQTTPMLKYASLAHFADQHQLVKIDDQYAYFDINGSIKRFPESGTLAGDSLSKIYFFTTSKELQHFDTLMQLKFSDYKFTTKVLDQQLDEKCWKGYHKEGNKEMFGKTVPNCVKNKE